MKLIEVARLIKERRKELNLTLEKVAVRAGMTRSVLSKVENFRVMPSLPALAKIAEALETTVSELTRGVGEPSEISIVREGEGEQLHRDHPTTAIGYELLTHKKSGMLESLLITLPDQTAREIPTSHEGEEFFHVVEGKVTLRYGDEVFQLNPGDSAHFNANIPHCFTNCGDRPAKILATFGTDSKSGYCPNCSSRLFFLSNGQRMPGNPMGGKTKKAFSLKKNTETAEASEIL